MSGFRILDPFQVYTDLLGRLAAGGNLHFYAAGTTTDADVYADPDLTVNNGATVAIGTDGRPVDDIWGSAALSYRCRIYAADGTLIRDRDNLSSPAATSGALPAMVAGDFLSTDGSVWLMAAIRQMLDPTGQVNKVIGSDGTNAVWVDKPSNGTAGADGTNAAVTVTPSSVKWSNGTGDLFMIQGGSSSAPASGSKGTSKAVTFPTPFKTILIAFPIITSNSFAVSGYQATISSLNKSTTGFTASFDTNSSDGSNGNIVDSVPFDWIALGTVAS